MADRFHDELNQGAIEKGLWDRPRAEAETELVEHFREFANQQVSRKVAAVTQDLVTRDEYQSAAMIGLLRAVRRYDPASSTAAFTTYAMAPVWGAMGDVDRDMDWVPAKARSEDKKRDHSEIPLLYPMTEFETDTLGSVMDTFDESDTSTDVERLLADTDPRAVKIIRLAMSVGFNERKLAKALGVTSDTATRVYLAALEAARKGGFMRVPPATPRPKRRKRLKPVSRRAHLRLLGEQKNATARRHLQKIRRLIANGATTVQQVAYELGMTPQAVYLILKFAESLPEGRPQFPSRSAPVALAGC